MNCIPVEADKLRLEVRRWEEVAGAVVVASDEDAETAGTMLRDLAALRRRVNEIMDPAIRQAYAAHRAMIDAKKALETPLERAEKAIKAALAEYLEEKAARQRALALAEAEAKAREVQEQALATASQLESVGLRAEAEAILEQAITAPTMPPPVSIRPAAPGVTSREVWRAQVVDLFALVAFVASNPGQIGLIQPNERALNELARAQKSALAIPGVRAVCETVIVAR